MNAVSNTTQADEMVFDDVAVDVPDSTPYETIPAGVYNARLVGFKSEVAKPEWKLKGEEGEDKYQYEWTLVITDGEYEGLHFKDYTNRTWHEKATAGKHAAALLGVPALTPGIALSTRALAGRTCQMWLVEVPNKKGEMRNYIDKLMPMPAPRMRPQRAHNGTQGAPSVPRIQVPGYPDDSEIEF